MINMFTITPLKKGEASKFSQAIREAIHSVPGFPAAAKKAESRNYTLAKVKARIGKTASIQLVAKEKKKIVDVCYGICYAGVCYLEWIGVNSDNRRRGIGEKLVKALEIAARAKKIHKIWLNIDTHNPASKKLFRSMGYRPIGIVKKQWYGTDNMLMDKLISQPHYGRS